MAASLETYRSKRNFKLTREPSGRRKASATAPASTGHRFVVQKHDATRLHYDFRLEMDGVLKSWAVTRGPSLDPGEKRLAVHVEDHPLDYGDFEGTIPEGEYGGGTVLLWDIGNWIPDGDPHKGYAKGHMEFTLDGEKLKGRWHLVRMHGRRGEKRENWLLIKGDDEEARPEDGDALLKENALSVKTGRNLDDIAGEAPGWSSKTGRAIAEPKAKAKPAKASKPAAKAKKTAAGSKKALAPLPDFIEPQLATLVATPPSTDAYIHEIKFDGYRIIARIEDGKARLLTRSGLDWTEKFGEQLEAALSELDIRQAIIDGEVVVEDESGSPDFSALQADLSEDRSDRFRYYTFDLLHLDGEDLLDLPLVERKERLQALLPEDSAQLRFSAHFSGKGEEVLSHACRLGLEGIVSKRADAPYRSGRSKSWLKAKCSARQEFVVAGFVPSTVSRKAIGALLLGIYEGDALVPVGRVGTGFSRDTAEMLFDRLKGLRVETSPYGRKLTADEARGARYCRPELVAEVEFRAWTGDGHLRHASFRGLREDKPATEVQREQPAKAGDAPMKAAKKSAASDSAPAIPAGLLTHPDRVYWPEQGVTKLGLAEYYAEIWPHIEPYVKDRPLALLRCPEGIRGESFFQKHGWKGRARGIDLVEDPGNAEDDPLIAIRSREGLIALAQAAALELHPWGAPLGDLDRPDLITLDLDPGEGVDWEAVIAAAFAVRERLEKAGLSAFVKTSGGKGLHVVSPLKPKAGWEEVKAFTHRMADELAADEPDLYVSTITKAKRTGRVFVDYLRNQRGMTAVAPFSPRARPGAAVSMPLGWDELNPSIGPSHFTILNAMARLDALKSDPWADFRTSAKPLPED